MKKVLFILSMASLALASCNKDSSLVGTTTSTTGVASSLSTRGGLVVDTVGIPASVYTMISTKYPGYTISVVESDTERNGAVVYEVQITNSTTKKYLEFDSNWNFLHEEAANQCFNVIPLDIVRTTFKDSVAAAYPGYTVVTVKRENQNGVLVYEVEISGTAGRKSLIYDANWKFLMEEVHGNEGRGRGGPGMGEHGPGGFGPHDMNPNDTISLAVIPQSVKDSIATLTGYSIVLAQIDKHRDTIQYTILISNGTTRKILHYTANWIFIAPLAIPATVAAYVNTNYAGYTIAGAHPETDRNGVLTYDVEIVNITTHDRKQLSFSAAWAFLMVEH